MELNITFGNENLGVKLPCVVKPMGVLLIFLSLAGHVWSGTITVLNPGFEDDILTDGSYTSVPPTSWNSSSYQAVGSFNPTTSQYPGEAPEGNNVAWINGGEIWQVVTGNPIQAGVTYTLGVQVGYRSDVGSTPYTVELRAGSPSGMILAQKSQLDVSPAIGSFSPLSLTFTALAGEAYIGQDLVIQMTSGGVQTNFDNVWLTAVPLPPALPLFAAGLGLLGFMARCKASV